MAFAKEPMIRSVSEVLFKAIDLDNSSTIEAHEFEAAQQRLAESSPVTPRMGSLSAVDMDADGRIDLHEWLHFMEGLLEVFGTEQFAETVQAQVKTLASRILPSQMVRIVSEDEAVHGIYARENRKPFVVYVKVTQKASEGCELQKFEDGWQLYKNIEGDVVASTRDNVDRAEWIARNFNVPNLVQAIQMIDPNLPDMPTYKDKDDVWSVEKFPMTITWKPIRSLMLGRWQLFHGIGPQDLLDWNLEGDDGGATSNCWVLSAIAAVAEWPLAIRQLFVTSEFNIQGMYELKLFNYVNEKWEKIILDENVPCIAQTCTDSGYVPIGAQPNGPELWPLLLEKAFAKLFGGYHEVLLNQGNPCAAFRACTGHKDLLKLQKGSEGWEIEHLPPKSLTFERKSQWCAEILGENREEKLTGGGPEQLWEYLENASKQNFLMAAALGTDRNKDREDGLVENITYTILMVIGDLPSHDRCGRRMVSLRNPMGGTGITRAESDRKEWKGAWSDGDSMWNQKKEVRDFLRPEFKNDGQFWMAFEDFASIFDRIYVCAHNMKESFGEGEISSKLDFKKTRPKPKSRKQAWTKSDPIAAGATGRILTGGADCKLRIINGATGNLEGEVPHDDWIYALAFAPQGPKVATAGRSGKIRIVNIDNCQDELVIEAGVAEQGHPLALAWCPRKIAAACQDGELKLFDANTAMKIGSIHHGGPINSLALSPDKKSLVSTCHDSYCRIIDVVGGNVKEYFQSNYKLPENITPETPQEEASDASLTSCTLSNTGMEVILGDEEGRSKIVDTPGVERAPPPKGKKGKAKKKGKKKGAAEEPPPEEPRVKEHTNKGAVRVIACSPDGQLFATGSDDGMLRVAVLETGKVQVEVEHGAGITSLAWGPGGAKVASGCADGKLRVVDAAMGHTDFSITHDGPVLCVAWMPGDPDAPKPKAQDPDVAAHENHF